MPVSASAEPIVRSTMTAMVTLIMGRNDATRSLAEGYSMQWKGETLSGVSAAERVLIESLTENADLWIEYLMEPGNRKAAVSMDAALNADLLKRLTTTSQGARVAEALDSILSETPTGQHAIIDLRSEEALKA